MDLKKPSIAMKSTKGLKQGPVGSPTYSRRDPLNDATEGPSVSTRTSSSLHRCCELIDTGSCLRALAAVAWRLLACYSFHASALLLASPPPSPGCGTSHGPEDHQQEFNIPCLWLA